MSIANVSDVVIVGAGLSGLVSAIHLLDAAAARPASITVLEGRSRVGGRLQAHEGISIGTDGVRCSSVMLMVYTVVGTPRGMPADIDLVLDVSRFGTSIRVSAPLALVSTRTRKHKDINPD